MTSGCPRRGKRRGRGHAHPACVVQEQLDGDMVTHHVRLVMSAEADRTRDGFHDRRLVCNRSEGCGLGREPDGTGRRVGR